MFYIYKHTSPTGKSYIGQTTEINRRWSPMRYEGCKKFFYAIMMHGWNNFTHEILAECETQEEADALEKQFIVQYDSINDGYNISSGGQIERDESCLKGRKLSEETKEKLRKSYKHRELTPEEREKISERNRGSNNPMYGKNPRDFMTEGQIAAWSKKISENTKGGRNPASKPVIIVDTFTGEEIYCEYRREAKDKIGVCGAHIPKYIRENKLYKNRYRFKEVA